MEITWKWAACGYTLMGYKTPDDVIKLCQYSGFQSIEMNLSFSNNKKDSELTEIGKQYKDNGITIYSFHLPFTEEDDVAAFYETKRRYAVEKILRIMEQAAILGNKVVVLHPTTNHSDVNTEGLDKYIIQLGKSMDILLPSAEKLNLIIAIENMPPINNGMRFGSIPEHFVKITEEFAHPNLGFCLDTGHANISCGHSGPMIFFNVMKDRLVNFHLQDNPGDRDLHIAPGYGNVNWKNVFTILAEMKFSHPVCIETPPFGYLENSGYSPDNWKKLFDEVDSLARSMLK